MDCHEGAESLPHPKPVAAVQCARCHDEPAEVIAASAHGKTPKPGHTMPTCASCHGTHDVHKSKDADSKTAPLHIVATCGQCHGGTNGPSTSYVDSVHGRAFLKGGLMVAATCTSCHGSHAILPTTHPSSTLHNEWVANTCGKCHTVPAEEWRKSVHGPKPNADGADDKRRATCTSCHPTHSIPKPNVPSFQRLVVSECGTCHSYLLDRYRDTYHGRATELGSPAVARCSDCHGSHAILPASNPASSVNPRNLIDTCAKCHADAPPAFASYIAHPDATDRKRDPVLFAFWFAINVILWGSFGVFGVHTVLWLARELWERRSGHAHASHSADGPYLYRFSPGQRASHALLGATFFGLALTGMPLRYFDSAWAVPLLGVFGGITGARLFHRFFALTMIAVVGVFVIQLVAQVRSHRREKWTRVLFGPESIVPLWKDLRDFAAMFRWFLGRGPRPEFDRWIYFEKLEFWAILWGTVVIGATGFIMWFPSASARILPGWANNVALVIHSTEALLAVGMSLVVHLFNTSLRPGKFPFDPSMITGKTPEAEIREEKPLYYARLVASGRIEKMRVPPPSAGERRRAAIAGIAMMGVAFVIVAFIVYAYLA